MSLGLLILRVVVGGLFIGHGTQKLFGWFGGPGPEGAGQFFDSLGYRESQKMARLAGATEAGAGVLLALGLFTPLAAAAIVGVMLNAAVAAHRENGLWNSAGGYEYPLVLATAATALAFVGPGAASLDNALGLSLVGLSWGFTALLLGLVVGAATLAMRNDEVLETAEASEEEDQRQAA